MAKANRIGIGAITTAAFTVLHESKRMWPFNKFIGYIPSLTEAISMRMQHVQFVNQLLEKRRKAQDPEPDLYVVISKRIEVSVLCVAAKKKKN